MPARYYEVEPYRGPEALGSPAKAIAVTADSPRDAALLILGEELSLSGAPAQARAKVSFIEPDGLRRTLTLYAKLPTAAG